MIIFVYQKKKNIGGLMNPLERHKQNRIKIKIEIELKTNGLSKKNF